MTNNENASMLNLPDPTFIATKEYRRFAEFCDSCKESGYIGLCYGPPGVGKTNSARRYTNTKFRESYLDQWRTEFLAPIEVRDYDTILYTPPVVHSARDLQRALNNARSWLSILISSSFTEEEICEVDRPADYTKLILVDECDRLTAQGFEFFRSIYDEEKIAVIFMGMPGLEKRVARYAQLYSRIGFVHEFKTLSLEEVRFIIENRLSDIITKFKFDDFTDIEALTALVRTTAGNFRLLHRLLMQVERLMRINGLRTITKEVVDAARQILIIGTD